MSVLQAYIGGRTARAARDNAMALASLPKSGGMSNPMEGYKPTPHAGRAEAGSGSEIGMRLASDLMRDFGLSPAAAAGFVGNLDHESGGFNILQEIDPMIEGSRGGFGYAQWTGPRRKQFEAWAAQNGLDPSSYEANYGFLAYELANTPEGRVLEKLQGVDDPQTAARIVSDTFLRPGIPHMESRLSRAMKYYNPMGAVAGM